MSSRDNARGGTFAPIAIVGRGCVLPGALNPQALWEAVLDERDLLTPAPEGAWRLDPQRSVLAGAGPVNDRGGYVRGFQEVFDPEGFQIPAEEIDGLDESTLWLLHAGREALREAGHSPGTGSDRVGAFVGNLSLPTIGLSRFAESVWLAENGLPDGSESAGRGARPDPRNRFMSGYPVHLLARALGIAAGVSALDAACASSLYALRLACDALHQGRADLMLAGALNGTDPLFLHSGFRVLQALSPTGRSRPFHRDADGLVPALGAALVVLKRLEDAVAAGDPIFGVIRAVGLSNDGGSAGLLVPAVEGQERAIRAAYAASGLKPSEISLIECHATGTPVGDGAEIRSTGAVFEGLSDVPIGSLKSNLGHALTVAGSAGLLKVLAAMEAGVRPPMLYADEELPEIAESPFRLLRKAEPWDVDGVRRAAISGFGFGGNNAHLLVEQWEPGPSGAMVASGGIPERREDAAQADLAIVAMGVIAAGAANAEEFAAAVLNRTHRLSADSSGGLVGIADGIHLDLRGLRFPPNDLHEALPQQVFLLHAAREAIAAAGELPAARTGVFVGMQCDAEIARNMARLRLVEWAPEWAEGGEGRPTPEWVEQGQNAFAPPLTPQAVLGTLPNVVANRLNAQFRFGGPGFSISAEELSGIVALETAAGALRRGEVDAAVVGAVDLCCEPVHRAAMDAIFLVDRRIPGDAAVVLVLKRLADAERDGNEVLAVLPDQVGRGADDRSESLMRVGEGEEALDLAPLFGHAHAASGLLGVAAATVCCAARARPSATGPAPWLTDGERRAASISIRALGGEVGTVLLREGRGASRRLVAVPFDPRIDAYAGANRHALVESLREGRTSSVGDARLTIASFSEAEREERHRLALAFLQGEAHRLPEGVFLREKPVQGEVAFVFTGAGAAYRDMGRDLVVGLPAMVAATGAPLPRLRSAAEWIYRPGQGEPTAMEKLTGSSFLCQLHAQLSRTLLGLSPTVALGLSSGETNSLVALGAWTDFEGLLQGLDEIYLQELGGEFRALEALWGKGPHGWEGWRILKPAEVVEAVIGGEPRVFLTMRHAPGDCAIGGEPAACQRVLDRVGREHAYPISYDLAVHCPALAEVEERWWQLHHQPTRPVPGVRFYSASQPDPYDPTAESVADALTGMAAASIDFQAVVERAYADGARIFIEHGPRDLCTRWIGKILGEREHLAVSLDRPGTAGRRQLVHVAAELIAGGVELEIDTLLAALQAGGDESGVAGPPAPTIAIASHPEPVRLPPLPRGMTQKMVPAPQLPPVLQEWAAMATTAPETTPVAGDQVPQRVPMEAAPREAVQEYAVASAAPEIPAAAAGVAAALAPAASMLGVTQGETHQQAAASQVPADQPNGVGSITEWNRERLTALSGVHREFLAAQARVHQHFIGLQAAAFAQMSGAASVVTPRPPMGAQPPIEMGDAPPAVTHVPTPPVSPLHVPTPGPASTTNGASGAAHKEMESASRAPAGPPPRITPPAGERPAQAGAGASGTPGRAAPLSAPRSATPAPEASPPLFDRADLEHLASGRISDLFGPLFRAQDDHPRQVRMPMPPLLLADRVISIDAEPATMGVGSIITETDITADAWYLHNGCMPPGIQIESGQADLLLCSWLGADLLNKGDRVYRLLGCELTFHGTRPRVGETIQYDIHIDRHARTGDTRLFFFQYDSTVNGEPRLSVRGGHAGFFTDEELKGSGGVIWDPAAEAPSPPARPAPAQLASPRTRFDAEQVRAFSEGRPFDCFGPGFELAAAHTRSPSIQRGDMLLLDEVTEIDPEGGPWGLGYLRATRSISADDWFFPGHFKNDPTMPGTLMFEGGLQAMAFYLAALGYSIERDGYRFEPVTEVAYPMVCRGQITPGAKELVCELFVHGVEDVGSGAEGTGFPPSQERRDGEGVTLWADILISVDGLKAFHCRRMGLRLAPAWPLEDMRNLPVARRDRPVANVDGFAFDFESLLNCAWGRPSLAFGPRFERFDSERRLPRLPGLPYHFISRVTSLTGEMGDIRVGAAVEVEYDVPPDAWYFQDSPGRAMPFGVLMEAALQPCGWLTAYMGIPLALDTDLRFRNLNGDGKVLAEVRPDGGILRTTVRCTDVSRSGETFIETFEVNCYLGETHVYALKTTFGHFPKEALAQQVGVPFTEQERIALEETRSDVLLDLRVDPSGPAAPGAENLGIGRGLLSLLDRVTGDWPEGGRAGRGRLRAEMLVDPAAWFFRAHFFQDPVQPGSLGVEAMIQLLQHYMLSRGLAAGMNRPRFQAIEVDQSHSWRYRGQVVPTNRRVLVEMEISDEGRDELGPFARAEAWLWVDGKRIYHARNLGMRIVEERDPSFGGFVEVSDSARSTEADVVSVSAPDRRTLSAPDVALVSVSDVEAPVLETVAAEETLDPAWDVWLQDHRPTYTVPALPMTFMADRLAAAVHAIHPGRVVVGLEDVQVSRWLVCDRERRIRTEVTPVGGTSDRFNAQLLVWRDASVAALSRFEPVARGTVIVGDRYGPAPAPLAELPSSQPEPDPYASGALIHGPSFQILRELHIGSAGSTATLDAGGGAAPPGLLNPLLLDGITHAIPNSELWRWAPEVGDDRIAYPARILTASFHGPTPTERDVTCEVRFEGFHENERSPRFRIQLRSGGTPWADLVLVAALNPKGPIGRLTGPERQSFIRDRRPVPHAGLSVTHDGVTRLDVAEVGASDWLPGTVNHLYRSEARGPVLAREIAIKEHVGRVAGVHPETVTIAEDGVTATCAAFPLSRFTVAVDEAAGQFIVRDAAPERLDLTGAREYWQHRLGAARWPVEDMYFAMAEKFVRRVVFADPEGFARIQGRSALFVGNHQVAVESFLFALLNPGLTGVASVVLAKSEVRTRWLDEFLTLAEAYPGVELPSFIIYMDQKNPAEVLETFARCKDQMANDGLSALVHIEGTRSVKSGEPVRVISSSLLDMAMGAGAPIVPVRFVGGLPTQPLEERLHIPVGHGSQDYVFGRPIFPKELEAVPYAQRRQLVLDAINALEPTAADERPNAPDPAFEQSVHSWMESTGTDEEYSILLRAVERLDDPGGEMRRMLDAISAGELRVDGTPLGEWTAELARRLFGPRGPRIEMSSA